MHFVKCRRGFVGVEVANLMSLELKLGQLEVTYLERC